MLHQPTQVPILFTGDIENLFSQFTECFYFPET